MKIKCIVANACKWIVTLDYHSVIAHPLIERSTVVLGLDTGDGGKSRTLFLVAQIPGRSSAAGKFFLKRTKIRVSPPSSIAL